MAAAAPAASSSSSPAALAWTPAFRQGVIDKVFAAVSADAAKRAALKAAFGLQKDSWATAAELAAEFGARDWLKQEKDLAELIDTLTAVEGVYPQSDTGFRWDWTEEQLQSLAGEVVARSQRVLDGIASLKPGQHTFLNTLEPLNANDRIVDVWSTNVSFLGQVSASKPIRDVSTELSKAMSEFEVAQSMRVDLYESLKAFSETAEAQALQGEHKRFLEYSIRDFRRNGLHLPAEQRARIEAIKKRMSGLGITFQKNLGEENSTFEFTAEQLKGIPADQLARFTKKDDKYVVSLKYPDYFPAMELCSVAETRRTLEFAFNNRCKAENTPILEELVRLRAEQAQILGYPNHAAYVLEIRMAKSPQTVGPFLRELSAKLTPLMNEELTYWKQLKADEAKANGESGPATTIEGQTIHPYDVRYLTRLSELLKYKVDDQAIKQYFPLEIVTAGLLDIYQRTLGMVFEEVDLAREAHCAWHPEVRLFRVKDKGADKTRAFFYLDLFPRDGKYGHAAVWGLRPGCAVSLESNTRQLPVAGMVCNFTKPTAEQPSLLTHQEVVTFFHEFGHVAHQICSEVKFARFAGTSVERDFVEAPSQMLENWCYESEPLLLMSGHVDDHSKKLPAELIAAIAAAKKANAGIFNKRQCILGLFDQHIHTCSVEDSTQVDTAKAFEQISAENWPIVPTPGTNFAAGFGHLAGGYDSQYYGYMWSEVYSADMFASRFLKEGLLNEATGQSYRKEIISRGGSVDAFDMLRNFLGREPNDEAFLKSKGLQI